MFKFRKKSIDNHELKVLQEVATALESRFPQMLQDLASVRGRMKDPVAGRGWCLLFDDPDGMTVGGSPLVTRIRGITAATRGDTVQIEIGLTEGLWSSYASTAPLSKVIPGSVNVDNVDINHVWNDPPAHLAAFYEAAGTSVASRLDSPRGSTELEVDGEILNTILRNGGGDFLAVDSKSAVWVLRHDLFETRELFADASTFRTAVESGRFDLDAW